MHKSSICGCWRVYPRCFANRHCESSLGFEFVVVAGADGLARVVRNARVQKSGLALVGHFHGVESWRIQILGATELSFLEGLAPEDRAVACQGVAALRPCAFIV